MFSAPLNTSHFNLNTSAVAGVFGGEEAVAAMATVHVYEHRKWLGWYNSPGSYTIAKRYGRLAKSRFFDGLFPGVQTDPATLFELDGLTGPKFTATHSGTVLDSTGHLAALLLKECSEQRGVEIEGRKTLPIGVSVVRLNHVPTAKMHPAPLDAVSPVWAVLPISVSLGACAACATVGDWYSFSMILLGTVASGLSCLVIGSGEFMFSHPEPAKGSPPGDGILGTDREIVLLTGVEGAVNSVTRGRFTLRFQSEPHHRNIGWCSVLLMIQFLAQLLLVPQGTLFGQIMFVASLVVSWAYNLSLSSLDRERIQRRILLDRVLEAPQMSKYTLGTRTSMVVFALLVLKPEQPEKMLEDLLSNDTRVWKKFKATILQRLREKQPLNFSKDDWEHPELETSAERQLLTTLFGDAQAAYDGYRKHCSK